MLRPFRQVRPAIVDELLPMAERWGHHHISIMGIIAGMLLMAIVLI